MKVNQLLRNKVLSNDGLALIEVLAVLVIIGILTAIAVPITLTLIEKSKADVCDANIVKLERSYEGYIQLYSVNNPEILFDTYLREYWGDEEFCPLQGKIEYKAGKIDCSIHSREIENVDDGDGESGGGVPFF